MPTATKTKVIDHDVRTAYNQWTQFEEFPRFMEGVESSRRSSTTSACTGCRDRRQQREWDAEITEQIPDQRIAWRTIDGQDATPGVVTFHRLADADTTGSPSQMDYEPEGIVEKAGDALGFVDRRVEGDLERFKEFIESAAARDGRLARRAALASARRAAGRNGRSPRSGAAQVSPIDLARARPPRSSKARSPDLKG